MKKDKTFRPDRVLFYFKAEWLPLAFVTLSGLVRRSSAEVRSFRRRVVNLCVRKKDSRKRLQSVKNTVSTDL